MPLLSDDFGDTRSPSPHISHSLRGANAFAFYSLRLATVPREVAFRAHAIGRDDVAARGKRSAPRQTRANLVETAPVISDCEICGLASLLAIRGIFRPTRRFS